MVAVRKNHGDLGANFDNMRTELMKRILFSLLVGVALMFLIGNPCLGQPTQTNNSSDSQYAGTPLPRSTPEAEGISSEAVLQFVEAANKNQHPPIASRAGVPARPCHCRSHWWKPEAPNKPPYLYGPSAKSFNSTAVPDLPSLEGKLSLHYPILKFFPVDQHHCTDPSDNLKAVTVRDLLTL